MALFLKRLSLVFSWMLICLGLAVLVGWYFNIEMMKSVFPEYVSMKANTAFGILVMGLALWALSPDHPPLWRGESGGRCRTGAHLTGCSNEAT